MGLPAPDVSAPLLPPLPFVLDLSCPIALPSKPARVQFASGWPYPVAGPSTEREELAGFVRRRYLETLYFGETLFPIAGLLDDLARAAAAHNDALDAPLAALLLPLTAIEGRFRRTLLPVIAAAMAVVETAGNIDMQAETAELAEDERDVLASAVDVRMRCRAIAEGERGLPAKAISDELERREVLIQLVLLLFYRGRNPTAPRKEHEPKRRESNAPSVLDDPEAALTHLADRIGVWLAVAELGIGAPTSNSKGKSKEDERSPAVMFKHFWERVLIPVFLPREATYLSAFHLKVFGTPMPAELVPQKKPRKPKVTRRLSVDEESLQRAPPPKMPRRSVSHASVPGRASPPPQPQAERQPARAGSERGLRRALSRAGSHYAEGAGSRSSSIDPGGRDARNPKNRSVMREPSGKDLFKGREVVLRRAPSLAARTKDDSQRGTAKGGLLGRQAASASLRRAESQSAVESVRASEAETLIFATPAKPRNAVGPWGAGAAPGAGRALFAHPTPIAEEPSSVGSRSSTGWVAETPVGHRRTSIAETPVGTSRHRVLETPTARRISALSPAYESEDEEEAGRVGAEDDDLGGLMVPTDDEDDEDDEEDYGDADNSSTRTLLNDELCIPETPRRV